MNIIVIISVLTFIIMLAILAVSILAVLGAIDCHKSAQYVSNSLVKSAHRYFTINSILGIVFVFILIVIFVILIKRGKIKKEHFQSNDGKTIVGAIKKNKYSFAVVIILFVFNILVFLVLGALFVVAAVDLQNIPDRDDNLKAAYQWAIYGASTALAGSILTIIAVILGFWLKHKNEKKAGQLLDQKISSNPTIVPQFKREGSEALEMAQQYKNSQNEGSPDKAATQTITEAAKQAVKKVGKQALSNFF